MRLDDGAEAPRRLADSPPPKLIGTRRPSLRIIGCVTRPSPRAALQPKRATSQIQASLTRPFSAAVTRLISPSFVQTLWRQPTLHSAQGVLVSRISHTRAVKRYLLSVSAPTGQMSMTLPETTLVRGKSSKTPTSVRSPRCAQPNSAPPSISSVKRMQRVQCTQRFISGLMKGLISLSGYTAPELMRSADRLPVGHRLILEGALAALIAHRTVERVVFEQKLEHPLLGFDDAGGAGADDHPLGRRRGAGGLKLRDRPAVAGVQHLHEAGAALAHDGEVLVVAEVRDVLARPERGLEDGQAPPLSRRSDR